MVNFLGLELKGGEAKERWTFVALQRYPGVSQGSLAMGLCALVGSECRGTGRKWIEMVVTELCR